MNIDKQKVEKIIKSVLYDPINRFESSGDMCFKIISSLEENGFDCVGSLIKPNKIAIEFDSGEILKIIDNCEIY